MKILRSQALVRKKAVIQKINWNLLNLSNFNYIPSNDKRKITGLSNWPAEGWYKLHFAGTQRLPCSSSALPGLSQPSHKLPVQSHQRSCTWRRRKLKWYWNIAPVRFYKHSCSAHKSAVTSSKPSNSLMLMTTLANYQHMTKWKSRCHLKYYCARQLFSASSFIALILRQSTASVWEFRQGEKLGILEPFGISSYKWLVVGAASANKF